MILTIALAGGYDLYSGVLAPPADEVAGMTTLGAAEVAAVQPAAQSGAVARNRPAGASAPQMPIALPIKNPVAPGDAAPAGPTIEVARGDSSSDVPVNRAAEKTGRDDSAKNNGDEPQNRHDPQSVDIPVPAVETHDGVPGPSSSGVTAPVNKPDSKMPETVGAGTGIVKQPAETSVSARLHAAMKRPPASRAPFRHASLVHRRPLARVDPQYCEGDTSTLFGRGY